MNKIFLTLIAMSVCGGAGGPTLAECPDPYDTQTINDVKRAISHAEGGWLCIAQPPKNVIAMGNVRLGYYHLCESGNWTYDLTRPCGVSQKQGAGATGGQSSGSSPGPAGVAPKSTPSTPSAKELCIEAARKTGLSGQQVNEFCNP